MKRTLAALALACLPLLAHATCDVSGVNISFGAYDPLSAAPGTSAGSITVTCDQSPPATVAIQIGPSGTNGAFSPRQLHRSGGTDVLDYNLYVDPGGLQIWGDGTSGTTLVTQHVQKNKPWSPTVYARLPAGQDVTIGAYSDALTVTIQF